MLLGSSSLDNIKLSEPLFVGDVCVRLWVGAAVSKSNRNKGSWPAMLRSKKFMNVVLWSRNKNLIHNQSNSSFAKERKGVMLTEFCA